MTEDVRKPEAEQQAAEAPESLETAKLPWEPPKMEDVSEEVMAQPYIRFT